MINRISSGSIGLRNVVPRACGALGVRPSSLLRHGTCGQTVPQRAQHTRYRCLSIRVPPYRDARESISDNDDALEQSADTASEPQMLSAANAANKPAHQPLTSLLPAHPSHNSLTTFISHAQRSGLNPTRHTYLGTRYEYLTHTTLARFGLELLRIGKTGDKGVDLVGRWHLPSPQTHNCAGSEWLRVLVQCKRIAGKRKLSPSVVREMDGAFLGAPAGWKGESVFGVIVSTKPATKGVIAALQASRRALVWVCMEEHDVDRGELGDEDDALVVADEQRATGENERECPTEDEEVAVVDQVYSYGSVYGRVIQLLYNSAARQMGLEGLDVMKRHDPQEDAATVLSDGVVLIYRGRPVQEHVVS